MSTMTPNLEATPLPITWDGGLVFISYCLAVQAAYTAFQILQLRVKPSMYPVAAMCLGVSGIWSMHFIGMAAMSIDAHVTFDLWWTVASAIFAFVPCALGLALAGTKVPCETTEEEEATDIMANVGALVDAPHRWLLLSGACIALGACAMHYTGMHSMHSEATPVLDWGIIMLSCLIALFAGTAALYFALVLPLTRTYTLPTSFVAGVAVCGMHYSGMYGMRFELPAGVAAVTTHSNSLTEVVPYIVLSSSILSFSSQALATHLYRGKLEAQGVAQLAANVMTVQVLHCYRKYDTSEVTSILNFCTEEQVVDADLIGLFRGMNENLNQYRPFLPNYLFQDSDGDEDGEDDENSAGLRIRYSASSSRMSQSVDNNSLMSPSKSDAFQMDKSSSRFLTDHQSAYSTAVDSKLTSPPAIHPVRGSLREVRMAMALVDVNLQRVTSGAISTLGGASSLRRKSAPRHSNVVMEDASLYTRILCAISKNIYVLAKSTKASVHSMLGDTVQLSWNATSKAALHETKGALFLAQLTTSVRNTTGLLITSPAGSLANSTKDGNLIQQPNKPLRLELSAAISSGSATVHNITAANQQALIIDAPWLPALEGCFALAKQHAVRRARAVSQSGDAPVGGVILMDEHTKEASKMEVESIAVESLSYYPGECNPTFLCGHHTTKTQITGPLLGELSKSFSCSDIHRKNPSGIKRQTVLVYQMLNEKIRDDDEWMYQLQRDEQMGAKGDSATKAAELQLEAITAMSEGRFGEACSALETVGDLRRTHTSSLPPAVAARNGRGVQVGGAADKATPSRWFTEALIQRCQEALMKPPPQMSRPQLEGGNLGNIIPWRGVGSTEPEDTVEGGEGVKSPQTSKTKQQAFRKDRAEGISVIEPAQ